MSMSMVSAFWWTLVTNWGDRLTPLLLNRFSHVETEWTPVEEAEVVVVGSLLGNLVKPTYTGTILGSGKLHEDGIVPPNANILALRGPLTAKGVTGSFALGDPGLLADALVGVIEKRYEIGIVLHWSDRTLEFDERFSRYNPLIIRANQDPLEVVAAIGSCRKIVSSSLHGLIVADSFNIPRRFEETGHWGREGGSFKVRDHDAAIGLKFEVGHLQQAVSARVDDRKAALWDAFAEFGASHGAA